MSSDQFGIREGVAAKVLVIDDEAPIRLLCRVNLEAEGMDVIEAENGSVGVELARSERPDVILLDVMMPGMDGWEVLQALQSEQGTSEIPIVFLTARAELRDRAQGLELGGIDYVTKPFDPVGLAPLVHGLLERVERGEGEAIRQERIAALRDLLIE
jgi:DNA-binding response OmpR family regulator